MHNFTELDFSVLGVLFRAGPLTAYRVRLEFAVSTTAAFSSSTGSIYPSIRRLTAAGLVAAGDVQDRRGTHLLTITPTGCDRLAEWLAVWPESIASASVDPIRTRAQFLSCLDPGARSKFVDDARRATRSAIAALRALMVPQPTTEEERLEHLGDVGALYQLEARLRWLDWLEQELKSLPPRL